MKTDNIQLITNRVAEEFNLTSEQILSPWGGKPRRGLSKEKLQQCTIAKSFIALILYKKYNLYISQISLHLRGLSINSVCRLLKQSKKYIENDDQLKIYWTNIENSL